MGQGEANAFFDRLLTDIDWATGELLMFGRPVVTRRKVAWYGDRPFSYSRATKQALPWTPVLKEMKDIAEHESGERYNSCATQPVPQRGGGDGVAQ